MNGAACAPKFIEMMAKRGLPLALDDRTVGKLGGQLVGSCLQVARVEHGANIIKKI